MTQKRNKNEISLVGGGVEKGETHESCLKREYAEEAGYSIRSIRGLCDVDCYWLAGGNYPMRSLAHFYIVDVEEPPFTPTEEGHHPIWVDKAEAKALCPLPYHQRALSYYLTDRHK